MKNGVVRGEAGSKASTFTWFGLLTERTKNSLEGDFPALCHPVSCRAGLVRRPIAYTGKCQSHGEVEGPRTGVEGLRRHIQAHQASPLDFRNSFRYSIIFRRSLSLHLCFCVF